MKLDVSEASVRGMSAYLSCVSSKFYCCYFFGAGAYEHVYESVFVYAVQMLLVTRDIRDFGSDSIEYFSISACKE